MSDTLQLAAELMACPSITPNDAGCQRIIANFLSALHFHCEHLRFENVDNLWARFGNQSPLLVFAGHTDVVPTGPENEWITPPFAPTVRDDFLFGRGASDMKAAISAMMIAVKNFLQKHKTFSGSIAFLITSDEEGPSEHGTKRVIEWLQSRKEKIDYCMIGEPSSIETVGDQIRVGRRGSLHGKLSVHGKQGHVAHPHLAVNPIHQSAAFLNELVNTHWDDGNDHFPKTTFQITNIHSGTGATNVIPGHLDMMFNFRFGTASTIESLQTRVETLLAKYHLSYDLQWQIGAQPFLTQQGQLLNATKHAIKAITHLDVKLSTGGGTSDGRFIAPTGAEVVELGLSHQTAHHVNECIQLKDLEMLTAIYETLLEKLFLQHVNF